MGYLGIDNLYKARDILLFRECYALEKVHGTSAHLRWKDGQLTFFAGGAKHEQFVALFDATALAAKFAEMAVPDVTVYGEAYGGKMQKMSDTYGKDLRFIVFDVLMGNSWLCVPDMEQVAQGLGLEVVPWHRVSTDLAAIDAERDRPSEVAVRRDCGDSMKREGVVLRPLIELRKNNGERIIAKHKAEAFAETRTPRPVNTDELAVLTAADAIAAEWVTEMRLTHVLDSLTVDGVAPSIDRMGDILKAMVDDVEKEAAGEIVLGKVARRAVSKRAAVMFKSRLKNSLRESQE
jgi:hypothetical protein